MRKDDADRHLFQHRLQTRAFVSDLPGKPLSLRQPGSITQEEVPAEELGVVAGTETADVAVIGATAYAAGETWHPRQGTAGAGAIALLMHAVAARSRSGAALRAVRKAADGAVYLEGPRGEAEVTARALLGLIEPLA